MSFLDALIFGVRTIFAGVGATEQPTRSNIWFRTGLTATDDPATGRTIVDAEPVESGGGGGFDVQSSVAVDAGGLIIASVEDVGTFKLTTGTIVGDEDVTVPAAANDAAMWMRLFRNTTAFSLTITTGAGTEVIIGPGLSAFVGVDAAGAFEAPLGGG